MVFLKILKSFVLKIITVCYLLVSWFIFVSGTLYGVLRKTKRVSSTLFGLQIILISFIFLIPCCFGKILMLVSMFFFASLSIRSPKQTSIRVGMFPGQEDMTGGYVYAPGDRFTRELVFRNRN